MFDKFMNDLENILHSTPYSGVDILPLINEYSEGKNEGEISGIRMRVIGIIDELKEAKLIDTGNEYHWQLSAKIYGQYSEEPILIRSTRKFEEEYRIKNTPPVQPISNIQNIGINEGVAIQTLQLSALIFGLSKIL